MKSAFSRHRKRSYRLNGITNSEGSTFDYSHIPTTLVRENAARSPLMYRRCRCFMLFFRVHPDCELGHPSRCVAVLFYLEPWLSKLNLLSLLNFCLASHSPYIRRKYVRSQPFESAALGLCIPTRVHIFAIVMEIIGDTAEKFASTNNCQTVLNRVNRKKRIIVCAKWVLAARFTS